MDDSRRIKRRQIGITLATMGTLVILVVLGLYLSDPSRRIEQASHPREVIKDYRTPATSLDPSEVWIARSETELQDLKETNAALRRQLDDLQDRFEQAQQQPETGTPAIHTLPPLPAPPVQQDASPSIGEAPATRETSATNAIERQLPPPPLPARYNGDQLRPTVASNSLAPGILVVDLSQGSTAAVQQEGEKKREAERGKPITHHVNDFLPAGTFVKAVMLSGLDAPTGGLAKTNPQPVLLRLLDQGTLPNRFRSRVRECFVTAAGFGDLPSERAYLRLEKLSCVLHGGRVLEVALKGFVAGEDGKAGLRGRVVSKQGRMIARALIAGVAGGIGNGVAQSFTSLSTSALGNVQSVDPGNIAQYGVANGFSSALDRIAQWYLERANESYPVLEVDAGRVVEVVLNEGLELGVDLLEHARETGGSS